MLTRAASFLILVGALAIPVVGRAKEAPPEQPADAELDAMVDGDRIAPGEHAPEAFRRTPRRDSRRLDAGDGPSRDGVVGERRLSFRDRVRRLNPR